MHYSVIGASFENGSLAVFHAGLDDLGPLSFEAATQQALERLTAALAACPLPDIHALFDQVMADASAAPLRLQHLSDLPNDALSVSWYDDDHFVIAVMDASEQYQLHIEVVPIQVVSEVAPAT